jgi:hypothetical protein
MNLLKRKPSIPAPSPATMILTGAGRADVVSGAHQV